MTKPICDTTLTPRNPRTDCGCDTYPDNLGPCDTYEVGANGQCVFCDHAEKCHPDPDPVCDRCGEPCCGCYAEEAALNDKLTHVIEWWEGRCGDVIPNEHYQRLRPELYKIIGRELPD